MHARKHPFLEATIYWLSIDQNALEQSKALNHILSRATASQRAPRMQASTAACWRQMRRRQTSQLPWVHAPYQAGHPSPPACATATSKPALVLSPVPTAVPPCASWYRRGSVPSTRAIPYSICTRTHTARRHYRSLHPRMHSPSTLSLPTALHTENGRAQRGSSSSLLGAACMARAEHA
jgi:hypothetical protein